MIEGNCDKSMAHNEDQSTDSNNNTVTFISSTTIGIIKHNLFKYVDVIVTKIKFILYSTSAD